MPVDVAGSAIRTILDLFQQDKLTDAPKGIIAIELGGTP
jgi:hypothetical protein